MASNNSTSQVTLDAGTGASGQNSSATTNGTSNHQDRGEEKTIENNETNSIPKFRVETRPFAHKYYIRRPRALQYFQDGRFVESAGSAGVSRKASNDVRAEEGEAPSVTWLSRKQRVETAKIPLPAKAETELRSLEVPVVQRRRLDLFIDLLWVGIVSNLSEHFSETAFAVDSSYGLAWLEYIILFFVAWQIWNYLRDFLNTFFVDDLIQRSFILWILILALLYGNSATFFNESKNATEVVMSIYLIARGSFAVVEAVYVIFVPQLRAQFIIRSLGSIPVVSLFIGGMFVTWPTSVALYFPAIALESFLATMATSPYQDMLLRGQFRKAPDPDHMIERFESFFIVILGEGVFQLIKSSPLGLGVGTFSGSGVMVLTIYYFIFALYFASDESKHYIHAVRRSWLAASFWQLLHVFMYGSILMTDASWVYLITNSNSQLVSSTTSDHITSDTSESQPEVLSTADDRLVKAKWTVAVSLGTTLLLMTAIALSNRCLDPPKTLMVNNRLLRVLPRVGVAIVFCCINLKEDLGPQSLMAIIFSLLWLVAHWEWYAGLEKGFKFLEPRRSEG